MSVQASKALNQASENNVSPSRGIVPEPELYVPVGAKPYGAFKISDNGTALYLVAAYQVSDWRKGKIADKPTIFLYEGRVGHDKPQIDEERDVMQLGYLHDIVINPNVTHTVTAPEKIPFVKQTKSYAGTLGASCDPDVFEKYEHLLDQAGYPATYAEFQARMKKTAVSVDFSEDYRDSRDPGAEHLPVSRKLGPAVPGVK